MNTQLNTIFKEYDNFNVRDLRYILNEDTTLKRYYPLIPQKDHIIGRLVNEGIEDKYMYLSLTDEEICQSTHLSMEYIQLLRALFHLHDFKDRKLSEITAIESSFIEQLNNNGIKKSSQFMSVCINEGVDSVSLKYQADSDEVYKLLCLCDLMRLPGVKHIRAELYYNCGFKTIRSFVGSDAEKIRAQISNVISQNNLSQSVPLLKELKTQIAVASILPILN